MNKELEEYLLKCNLTKNELLDMENIAPMLLVTTLQEANEVINILVKAGYPQEDLTELFYQNPNILAMDAQVLKKRLEELALNDVDIEEYLKNNPFNI